ncbi:MAG: hypothetical protein SFW35_03625 [Chitinophagales bacterium]|nr:hypothetical protein [Chitinophagales bacterium]
MLDLGKTKTTINCPECSRKISITLNDIANSRTVRCSCGQTIKLVDKNGNNRQVLNKMNNSMRNLENSFKRLGNIKL